MFRRAAITVPFALLFAGLPASAGWITIKNETTQTIVIQETIVVNGATRRCKPVKLVPGEVFREYQATAGQKTIQVLESGLLLNRPLCQGELKWQEADTCYSVLKLCDKVKVLTEADAVAAVKALETPMARAQAPDSAKPKPDDKKP